MEVTNFNDASCVESATSYGTLKTRALELRFDFVIHNLAEAWYLLPSYGFDMGRDLIEIRCEPAIRRLTFYQKWWDRSKRDRKSEL